MPPPSADFSGSDEDVDEELSPEERDGNGVGDDMAVMEAEEDLDEEDGLGKSCSVLRTGFIVCYVT